ncbi:hypothetical protein Moror_16391 [Moniliophthora roreri MCA 2997]|uniref:Protein kinase domain-containing protein n=2 Tax=Moniliophthora roreri TaxID=221103 RepID=V2WVU7_MONRO|nr:hypothetical protein Moror_16391 [Moniliophthora roreri MCA 2997]KAI3601410.1 hypothetical protein WG66_002585 [Moniliophthora roreri]
MAFLQGSLGASISGRRFNYVQGSQHNTHIHGDLLQVVHRQDRESTVWDDYQCVRTGDIYVMRAVGTTDVGRSDDNKWRKVVARRIINLAQIGDSKKKFLHVTYDGPDAFKAFKLDFEQFSSVRNPNIAQLFGYNSRYGLPALIFHDELIPLSRIIMVNDQPSPSLWTYFQYQFRVLQIVDTYLDMSELWIDARTGTLRRGPFFQPSSNWYRLLGSFPPVPTLEDEFNPVSIQTYNESSTILHYLITKLSTRLIIKGIVGSSIGFAEWLTKEEAIFILTSLSGTVYNWRSREAIARWVDIREKWQYSFWILRPPPNAMAESRVTMEDGSVRFTVLPMDIQDLSAVELGYVLRPSLGQDDLMPSWLAQAHDIFSQRGIYEDEWKDYCICDYFGLVLRCHRGDTITTTLMSPIYLFIRPFPHPSDCETVLQSWVESSEYFWSFDASGKEEIPVETQVSLGLPSFTSSISFCPRSWNSSTYGAVEELHRYYGYDPRTTDLARSLGYPVLEIVGDDERQFQDLENLEVLSCSHVAELDADSSDEYTSSEGSESEEEIILYPRTRFAVAP